MTVKNVREISAEAVTGLLDRPDELLARWSSAQCTVWLADHCFTVGADDTRAVDYVRALFEPSNDVWRAVGSTGSAQLVATALSLPERGFQLLAAEVERRSTSPATPARFHVEAPANRYQLANGLQVLVALSTHDGEGPSLVAISRRGLVCVTADRPYGFMALGRILREYGYRRAETAGWSGLHASAAEIGGGFAVVAVGCSGAGKSTLALALAMQPTGAFLANDRVMVRPAAGERTVEACAMPVPIRVNAGTLGALGLEGAEAWPLLRPQPDFRDSDWREFGGNAKLSVLATEWRDRFGTRLSSSATVSAVILPRASRVPTPTVVRRVGSSEVRAALSEQCMTPDDDVFVEDWLGARQALASRLERQAKQTIDLLARLPAVRVEFGSGSSLQELAKEIERVVRFQ